MPTEKKNIQDQISTLVLAPLIAAFCFIFIYGIQILNPRYDDWLLVGGDLSQHYIGWEGFRNARWTFPLGLSDSLTYPTSISVIFTDSIPLLSVFFKLLSPILPDTFQYWGIWGLMAFILTALFSSLLIKKYSPHPAYTLLASLFFTLSPTIFQRLYGHESLGGGQWLILASLLPLVYYKEHYHKIGKAALFWALLAFPCVSIHIYFAVTCFFALLAFCLYDLLETKKLQTSILSGASYCMAALITTFVLGGLKGGIKGKGAGEVGEFSANLNCLFNPLEYSRFFPGLPIHGNGQYEGFAYLGLGIFVLLFLSLIFLPLSIQKGRLSFTNKSIALLVAAIMSFLFALSPLVSCFDRLLFSIPLPKIVNKLLVTFRSTGRMVWLCYYILYLAAISLFARIQLGTRENETKGKLTIKLGILAACLILQIIDISPLILHAQHRYHASSHRYVNPFSESPLMLSLTGEKEIKHICIVSELESDELYDIAQFAMEKGLTVNRFWTVHQIGRKEENTIMLESLSEADSDTIFLFKKKDEGLCKKHGLKAFPINSQYTIGRAQKEAEKQ